MRGTFKTSCLALLLAAMPALAQFEGTLEMKMSMADKEGNPTGSGAVSFSVAKAGLRSEMTMQHGPMGIKMVMLQKTDVPDKAYNIDNARRTYTEVDLARLRAMAAAQQTKVIYTVRKLGQQKILGYDTQHVVVEQQAAGGEKLTTEMWNAKGLMDYATFNKLQAGHGRMAAQEGMLKALKDAGADGMPLKSITTAPDGSKTTMEVVKVEKKSLPASTFELPAGYTKAAGFDTLGPATGPQADEARKRLDDMRKKHEEMMKNMTPEQRKMYDEMLKQRGNNP